MKDKPLHMPPGVEEWIEVAQQALEREGCDWDDSRRFAEAAAVKLWNYVSEGLLVVPNHVRQVGP